MLDRASTITALVNYFDEHDWCYSNLQDLEDLETLTTSELNRVYRNTVATQDEPEAYNTPRS
jgi:hypothetical protein